MTLPRQFLPGVSGVSTPIPILTPVNATTGNGPVAGFTQTYDFNLVNFDWVTWHDFEWENWVQVDALLSLAIGFLNIRGIWRPNTQYTAGDSVFDPNNINDVYTAQQDHTSGIDPTIDLNDPLLWEQKETVSPPVTTVFGRIGDVIGEQTDYDAFYSLLGHTHTESEITDLDKYTQAEVDAKDTAVVNNQAVVNASFSASLSSLDGRVTTNESDINDKMEYRGAWVAGIYQEFDVVTHAGSTWVVNNPSGTSQEPSGAASDWTLLGNTGTGTFLPLSGGTLTGNLQVGTGSRYSALWQGTSARVTVVDNAQDVSMTMDTTGPTSRLFWGAAGALRTALFEKNGNVQFPANVAANGVVTVDDPGVAAGFSDMRLAKNGVTRWVMRGQWSSDAFQLVRLNAGGAFQDAPIVVDAAAGNVSMPNQLSVTGIINGAGTGAARIRTYSGSNFVQFGWTGQYAQINVSGSVTITVPNVNNANNFQLLGTGGTARLQVSDNGGTNYSFNADTVSDARIKEAIADTRIDGMNVIDGIRLREFAFTQDYIDKTHCDDTHGKMDTRKREVDIGIIAQELQQIVPDAVQAVDNSAIGLPDDQLTISLNTLVPYLIKAVQELSARVKELEAQSGTP